MGRNDLFRRHRKVSPPSGFCVSGEIQRRTGWPMQQVVKFGLLCIVTALPWGLSAQWKFDMHVQVSGNCSGWGGVAKKNTEAALNHYWNSLPAMIPTKAACENARAVINGYTTKTDGCTARIICTPCIGRDIGNSMGGAAGDLSYLNNYQLGGPDKGLASFSSNPDDEIKQWQDEIDRKKEIFAHFNGASSGLGYIETEDPEFDEMYTEKLQDKDGILYVKRGVAPKGRGIYIGEGKFKGIPNSENSPVDEKKIDEMLKKAESSMDFFLKREWHSPEEMELYVQTLFEHISGYNIRILIEATRTRVPTREELRILLEYDTFKGKYYAAADAKYIEKIDRINMAENHHVLIAENVYTKHNDDNYQPGNDIFRIDKFNQKDILTQIPELAELSPAQRGKLGALLNGIEMLNNQGESGKTGFAASLYYDSKLKELVVAFRGTELTDIADILVDLQNAAGKLTHQYGSANALKRVLKEVADSGMKISIVGHSLGGGLASVLGLATGLPTYTYNAAGVNDNVLKKYGILGKKENAAQNITAYHSSKDFVSNFQDASSGHDKMKVAVDLYSTLAQEHPVKTAVGTAVGTAAVAVGTVAGVANTEFARTLAAAAKNASPALGKRVNIGDAGIHFIADMRENFSSSNRTYRSAEWTRLTNSRNTLYKAKEINTHNTMMVIQ